jgi:uncharacterized caspase-like protein
VPRLPLVALSALIAGTHASGEPVTPLDPYLVATEVPRYALVLGAERYGGEFETVTNAGNDARRIAEALGAVGFSFVRHLRDPTEANINDAINEIAMKVGDDPAIVFFYFAGHGFQSAGHNYIVPTSVRRADPIASSIDLSRILGTVVGDRPGLTIVLLDACRTSVSSRSTAGGARLGQSGFAAVGDTNKAVIGFAASFGSPALSTVGNASENSPYATALLKFIKSPEMSLDEMLEEVQTEVHELTLPDSQSPMVLKGAASTAFSFLPAPKQRDRERAKWEQTVKTGKEACVRRYIAKHPDSPYLKSALLWLSRPPAPVAENSPCP